MERQTSWSPLPLPRSTPRGGTQICRASFIPLRKNWAGGFCILRSAFCVPPRPFQQRTNTSCYLAIPTHGFTVVLSVFRGTPPAKPLKCKSVSNRLGARFRQRWTESTGGKPRLSCASIRLALSDIIETSFRYHSQTVHLSLSSLPSRRTKTKNPAYSTVSRV